MASPGDVAEERGRLDEVIDGLRRGLARKLGLTVRLLRWEDVPPDLGRPQGIIMDELAREPFDIFIGILWNRFGTPSGALGRSGQPFASGTHEEFEHALALRASGAGEWPAIMMYRRVGPVDPSTLDLEQFQLVEGFFRQFAAAGAHPGLAQKYDAVDTFAERVRGDLERRLWRYVEDAGLAHGPAANPSAPTAGAAHAEVPRTQLLIDYLDAVIRDTDELHPGGIRQVKFDLDLKLDSVYVGLRAERTVPDVDQRLLQEDLDELRVRLRDMDPRERDGQAEIWARDMRSLETAVQRGAVETEEVAKVVDVHRRVVLLGDPGGGKTTLLHWLALNFARAIRAEPGRILEPQPWWTPADDIWTVPDIGPVRVPIYMRIARYAEARDTSRGGDRTLSVVEFLPRYLAGLQIPNAAAVSDLLVGLLEAGRCFILLDGLDEITDYADRQDITENVVRFAGAFADKGMPGWLRSTADPTGGPPVGPGPASGLARPPSIREDGLDVAAVLGDQRFPAWLRASWHDRLDRLRDEPPARRMVALDEIRRHLGNHFLVTSRRAGYQFAPVTGGFGVYSLREMGQSDIERFLGRWCRAVELKAAGDEPDPTRIENRAQQEVAGILRSMESSPGVRRLARNPLLLRILALIHRNERHLPHKRAELYETATVTLLRDWQLNKGNKAGALDEIRVTSLLGPVAFWMHENRASAHIERSQALRLMASVLAAERGADPDRPPVDVLQQVTDFLESVRLNSGLFIERGEGLYGFMHLTFEEYFTARQMISDPVLAKSEILARLHEPRWREPILLAFGLMSRTFFQMIDDLLRAVLAAGSDYEAVLARDLIFAATCVSDSAISSYVLRREIAERLIARHLDRDGAGRYRVLREQIRAALSALHQEGPDDAVELALAAAVRAADGSTALAAALELVAALQPRGNAIAEALAAVSDTSKAAWANRLARDVDARAVDGGPSGADRPGALHRLVGALCRHGWSHVLADVFLRPAPDTELGQPAPMWFSYTDPYPEVSEILEPFDAETQIEAAEETLRLLDEPDAEAAPGLAAAAGRLYYAAPYGSELEGVASQLREALDQDSSPQPDVSGRIRDLAEALRNQLADFDPAAALGEAGLYVLRDTDASHPLLPLLIAAAEDLRDTAPSSDTIAAAKDRIFTALLALLETTRDGRQYYEAARMSLAIRAMTYGAVGSEVVPVLLAHQAVPGERSVWALQVLGSAVPPGRVAIPSEVADRLRAGVANGDHNGDLMLDVLFGQALDGPLLRTCWTIIGAAGHPHRDSVTVHLRAVTALEIDDAVMSALRDGYDRPGCRPLVLNLLLSAGAVRGEDASPFLAWLLDDVPVFRHRAALLLSSAHAGDPTRTLRVLLVGATSEGSTTGPIGASAPVRRLLRALWLSGAEALVALVFPGDAARHYRQGLPLEGWTFMSSRNWASSAAAVDSVVGDGGSPSRCPQLLADAADRLDSLSPGSGEPPVAAVAEVTAWLAERLVESLACLGLAPLGALRAAVNRGVASGWCRAVLANHGLDATVAPLRLAGSLAAAPDELRAAIAATLLACDVQLHLVWTVAEAMDSEYEQIRIAAAAALRTVAAALPTDGSSDAVEHLHREIRYATGPRATHLADAIAALNYSSTYWPDKWFADLRDRSSDADANALARSALRFFDSPTDQIWADLVSRLTSGGEGSDAVFEAAADAVQFSLKGTSGKRRHDGRLHQAVMRALDDPTTMATAVDLARYLEGGDVLAVAERMVERLPLADERVRRAIFGACQRILRYARLQRSEPLSYEAVVAAARTAVYTDIDDDVAVGLVESAVTDEHAPGGAEDVPAAVIQLVATARREWILRRALRDGDAQLDRLSAALRRELELAPADLRAPIAACLAVLGPPEDRAAVLDDLLRDDHVVLDVLLDVAIGEEFPAGTGYPAAISAIAEWVLGGGPDRAARLVAWALDALAAEAAAPAGLSDRRLGLTALLAQISDLTTPTTFFRRYPADAAAAVVAGAAQDPLNWLIRLYAVRCLGNLQQFTVVVADAFFLACQDVDLVFAESQSAVTKFKRFGTGSLERLVSAVRSPNVTVAANAAMLIGQLGLARSEELGREGRRRIADELVSMLVDDPSLTRRTFERGTGYGANKEGEPLYEVVFATLLRVVSGEDASP